MQIISRTVSILEEVARRPDGGGLVEIANACSLPAATCHRLLAALAEDELVQRDPLTPPHRVGPGVGAPAWGCGGVAGRRGGPGAPLCPAATASDRGWCSWPGWSARSGAGRRSKRG